MGRDTQTPTVHIIVQDRARANRGGLLLMSRAAIRLPTFNSDG